MLNLKRCDRRCGGLRGGIARGLERSFRAGQAHVRRRQRRHQAAARLLRAGGRRRPRRGAAHGRGPQRGPLRGAANGGRPRRARNRRRRGRLARRERRRPVRGGGEVRRRQHHRHRHPQRLPVSGASAYRRADEADRWPVEADRRGRDGGQRLLHRPAAPGQGPGLRRPRLAVCERRRAFERLPEPRPAARRQGTGSLPAARQARRDLEVRREQARSDAGHGHALRHRPAPDDGDHVARRRAVHRDAQPRSAGRVLAVALQRQGERRAPGGGDVPRGAGVGLRLAVLLLRLRDEDLPC